MGTVSHRRSENEGLPRAARPTPTPLALLSSLSAELARPPTSLCPGLSRESTGALSSQRLSELASPPSLTLPTGFTEQGVSLPTLSATLFLTQLLTLLPLSLLPTLPLSLLPSPPLLLLAPLPTLQVTPLPRSPP